MKQSASMFSSSQKETTVSSPLVSSTILKRSIKSQSPTRVCKPGRDFYSKEAQTLIDHAMKSIAEKIAEKRRLQLSIAQFRSRLNHVKEECKAKVEVAKSFKRKIEQVEVDSYKKQQENASLRPLLQSILDKTAEKQAAARQRMDELGVHNNNLWAELDNKRDEVAALRKELKRQKAGIDAQRARLETGHSEAGYQLELLQSQTRDKKTMDKERLDVVKEKARLLHSFIMNEGENPAASMRDAPLPAKISKILKSPGLSQSIS